MGKKKDLTEQTDIVNDLGLYGDDCIEFLEKFCEKFHIECSKLDFSKCGQEGIDPFVGVILWTLAFFTQTKKQQKNGYKVSELMKIVEENS